MSKKNLATGTSPFAHLLSGFRAKRADEDEPENPEGAAPGAEEDPEGEGPEDEPGEDDKKSRRGRKAKRAEDEDDEDQDPEADAGDDDDVDAEDDMDDDEKKAFRQGMALGRARETARCARIFGHKGAGARPDLAATLAFSTRNSSAEAGRILGTVGTAPPTRGSALDARMGARRDARPGADGSAATKPNFGERVAAAVKKAGR